MHILIKYLYVITNRLISIVSQKFCKLTKRVIVSFILVYLVLAYEEKVHIFVKLSQENDKYVTAHIQ